ncbi:hypothetical protein D3C81_1194330 [compost metagenome]
MAGASSGRRSTDSPDPAQRAPGADMPARGGRWARWTAAAAATAAACASASVAFCDGAGPSGMITRMRYRWVLSIGPVRLPSTEGSVPPSTAA